jgi:hypothetical protein
MSKKIYVLIFIVIQFACQESNDTSSKQSNLRSIGDAIPVDMAERWVEHYARKGGNARIEGQRLTRATLQELLANAGDYDGLVFHYGVNNNNQYDVFVIPYAEDNELWSFEYAADASVDNVIGIAAAKDECDRYAALHSTSTLYHFFGRDIFDELLSNSTFSRVDIVPGIADDGRAQLLLYTWAANATNGKAKEDLLVVYDQSSNCPPYCVTQ